MGAATEQRSFSEILKLFGGPVREFRKPPPDSPFSGGRTAGQVTDDSGQMLRMAQAIIESNGSLTVDGVVKQLLQWGRILRCSGGSPDPRRGRPSRNCARGLIRAWWAARDG